MEIVTLSDIHGNLAALDAVFDDVGGEGADLVVKLCDILSGPLYPSEAGDRQMSLRFPTTKGNGSLKSDRFAREALRADQLAWAEALPATLRLEDGVLLIHGMRHDAVFFPKTDHRRRMQASDARRCQSPGSRHRRRHDPVGHSHSHIDRAMKLADGRLIGNPGSVGAAGLHRR